jgi:4-hydroxy-3-polyprenylbenzoate decarboxylase
VRAQPADTYEIVVAISGASGAVYAERLLRALVGAHRSVTLLVTEPARLVIAHELGVKLPQTDQQKAVEKWLGGEASDLVRVADPHDLMDPICSGSHLTGAMVIIPCSMAMLSGVATGRGDDLVLRAADVMLKERRLLVLVPRETPLSLIHIRNMAAVAEAGAVVLPAMPGFYTRPRTVDDLVDHVVGKVLDQIGVSHDLFARWGEPEG